MTEAFANTIVAQLIGAGIGTLLGGYGAYIAIRVDLARLLQRQDSFEKHTVEQLGILRQAVDRAHQRIDNLKGG